MFRTRNRRRVPALNTTSTADISFMLLIFFLVTTSIDSSKGLIRRLPPKPHDTEQTAPQVVKPRNVLRLAIDGANRVTHDGKTLTPDELKMLVERFVENAADDPLLPEKHAVDIPLLGRCSVTDRHVIAIEVSRDAEYDAYFSMQTTIAAAYDALRDRLSESRFGHAFANCNDEERAAIVRYYPQRISETEPQSGREEGRP